MERQDSTDSRSVQFQFCEHRTETSGFIKAAFLGQVSKKDSTSVIYRSLRHTGWKCKLAYRASAFLTADVP
jgi:hypothetical protein